MADFYETSASYYDGAYAAKSDLDDEEFYLRIAANLAGQALEIGCGTGRILLPTAQQGTRIHGLDKSPSMLEILRSKVRREPSEISDRIVLHEGDMRNFSIAERFQLVTMPFRAMQHMYTLDDQVAALKAAREHLADDGRVVFDVFYPKLDRILTGVGEEIHELEWVADAAQGLRVRRAFLKEEVNKIEQWFSGRFIFRTYRGDELVKTENAGLKMSFYTYPHCRALFRLAGLRVISEWGSFDRKPLDNDADAMIFLLEPE